MILTGDRKQELIAGRRPTFERLPRQLGDR